MSEHKFRYLLPPGNNFQFVRKFRTWMVLSVLLMAGAIGVLFVNKSMRGDYMNWTIDFKGGTELTFAFKQAGTYVKADPAKIRAALDHSGEQHIEVSEISWADAQDGKEITVNGTIVRTTRFSALTPAVQEQAQEAFLKAFADRGISRATWSGGDRFNVRSTQPIKNLIDDPSEDQKAQSVDEARKVFSTILTASDAKGGQGTPLEVKAWSRDEARQYLQMDSGTKEYVQWFAIRGIDRQFELIMERGLNPASCAADISAAGCIDVVAVQSYGVGAKAGDKLRNDAAKAIVYAIFLIMLYLAFRFDVRYAPGAAFATIHDAIMVIGVFAVTWTEVSLTSVAGLLTVMGFSVNDTVIVFDRIRENQAKMKDKKLERIIDISLNEMLVRTILTSATVFATTLIMNIFGDGLVKNFAFAMNVGVIVGAYSSIFLAIPVFMWISKRWYSGPAPARRRGMSATPSASAPAEPTEPIEPAAPAAGDDE
ncbi:MAG: protein translocase subunit SecF [Kofleriaceae bacterium]